jgi:hypothetical protein
MGLKPKLPILNQVHPLARGVIAAWPMYEGAGTTIHDVLPRSGHHGTMNNMNPTSSWSVNELGRVIEFDGADDYIDLGSWLPDMSTGGFTVAILFRSQDSGYSRLLNIFSGSGSDDYFAFASGENNDNGQGTIEYRIGSTFRRYFTNVQIDDGKPHLFIASFDFNAGKLYGWMDGVPRVDVSQSEISTTGFSFGSENSDIHLGQEVDGSNRWSGYMSLVAMWRRAFRDSMARALWTAPFDMFRLQRHAASAIAGLSTTLTGTTITVTWQDNSENEDGFELPRRADGGSWETVTDAIAANAESYNDTELPTGHTYEYRIRALSSALGNSDWSNIAEETV